MHAWLVGGKSSLVIILRTVTVFNTVLVCGQGGGCKGETALEK